MNALNNLKNPKYFISDPWTNTTNDKSFWSNKVANLLNSVVNNNSSGKIKLKDGIIIILCILKYTRFKNYFKLVFLLVNSFKKKWMRALFLDFLINEINIYNTKNLNQIFLQCFLMLEHIFSTTIYCFLNSLKTLYKLM